MSTSSSKVRWIDLTEEQKKDVLRIRNADSARKFRAKKRDEEERVESLHNSNEKRMDRLERTVDSLTKEVQGSARSSRPSSSKSSSKGNKKSGSSGGSSSHSSKKDEERPAWFGDAF